MREHPSPHVLLGAIPGQYKTACRAPIFLFWLPAEFPICLFYRPRLFTTCRETAALINGPPAKHLPLVCSSLYTRMTVLLSLISALTRLLTKQLLSELLYSPTLCLQPNAELSSPTRVVTQQDSSLTTDLAIFTMCCSDVCICLLTTQWVLIWPHVEPTWCLTTCIVTVCTRLCIAECLDYRQRLCSSDCHQTHPAEPWPRGVYLDVITLIIVLPTPPIVQPPQRTLEPWDIPPLTR